MPARGTYAGLFLVAFAMLAFEILLTRIFSVTVWYHFAFVAVSVAMFGMTLGALAVYLRPAWFQDVALGMGWAACAFGVMLVGAVLLHVAWPTASDWRLPVTYVVTAVPFVFAGICTCLALTRYPAAVNRLYAADLAGAALGCVGFVALLSVMDAISALFAIAAIAIGAGIVLMPAERRRLRAAFAVLLAGSAVFSAVNNTASRAQEPLLSIRYAKMGLEAPPAFERWNAFSRITVHPGRYEPPIGWGMSPKLRPSEPVWQAWLRIDALAGTILTEFKGDLKSVEFLQYDIVNLAHHLRPAGRTLVIGAGGGRDVLSALRFGAPQVVAVEINGLILDTVHRRYGDFTGHLDRIPGVRFVNDEARSWAARAAESFDVVQVSWIDTWAATAAGAYALSENSLYTVEAWESLMHRLAPRGVMTFTRDYREGDAREAARLVALAGETLARHGVSEPARHIMMVLHAGGGGPVGGNATILVSRDPFSDADAARMRALCEELGFQLVARERLFALAPPGPYRLHAPTDDAPFFFSLLSVSRVFDPAVAPGDPQLAVAKTLLQLLATVVLLTAACLCAPLLLAGAPLRPGRGDARFIAFFAAIGLGFMCVEIALLQRLSLYLGHPTYGIGVVLFGLLLAGGAGSYLGGRGALPLAILAALVAAAALGVGPLLQLTQAASTPLRLAFSLSLLVPLGVLMGMAFPLGMRAAAASGERLLPWFWGINGAASVLASVLAAVVSLEWGITMNLWIGAACYALAAAMLRPPR